MSEGVVVETWDDWLSVGEWCVGVEEWVKKGKGKKRKSTGMYAVASALLFKTQAEADTYLCSAGLGNGEDGDNGGDGDNGNEGGNGDGDKGEDGGEPPAPSPPTPAMDLDGGASEAGQGQGQGRGRVKGRG